MNTRIQLTSVLFCSLSAKQYHIYPLMIRLRQLQICIRKSWELRPNNKLNCQLKCAGLHFKWIEFYRNLAISWRATAHSSRGQSATRTTSRSSDCPLWTSAKMQAIVWQLHLRQLHTCEKTAFAKCVLILCRVHWAFFTWKCSTHFYCVIVRSSQNSNMDVNPRHEQMLPALKQAIIS